jgi:hypothetical protein
MGARDLYGHYIPVNFKMIVAVFTKNFRYCTHPIHHLSLFGIGKTPLAKVHVLPTYRFDGVGGKSYQTQMPGITFTPVGVFKESPSVGCRGRVWKMSTISSYLENHVEKRGTDGEQ